MIDEEPKAEFPIGEAKKLDELAREKWDEHLLLFSRVKNTVLEVNPNVNLPFNLEKGKPSPLGLFAEAAFEVQPKRLPRGKYALEVWPGVHRRSAILGRIIFNDTGGRIYRDIDLKGIGVVEPSEWTGVVPNLRRKVMITTPGEKRGLRGRQGLLDRDTAYFDYQKSEEFLKAGIRTYRILAIIELKEITANQRKLSVLEAIKEGIINESFHPVVEVRAFGTKARIDDLSSHFHQDIKERKLLINDAIKLVSQELGYKDLISTEEYLGWFVKTLGFNVGLMHKNGWFHEYLSSHNISLDCRIADLDSVSQLTDEHEQERDLSRAKWSLDELLSFFHVIDSQKRKAFEKQLQESYDSVFPPKERERYFKGVLKEK